MKVICVRHGESEANLIREFSNRCCKHPLTEKGREQANELCQKLKSEKIIKIYSSPVLRAMQTSEIIAKHFNMDFSVDENLREFDVGIYEGTSHQKGWNRYIEVVDSWIRNDDIHNKMEGGESLSDIITRLTNILTLVKNNYNQVDGLILLVGHNGLYRCGLPKTIKNLSYEFTEKYQIEHGSLINLNYQNEEYDCQQWCGVVPFE